MLLDHSGWVLGGAPGQVWALEAAGEGFPQQGGNEYFGNPRIRKWEPPTPPVTSQGLFGVLPGGWEGPRAVIWGKSREYLPSPASLCSQLFPGTSGASLVMGMWQGERAGMIFPSVSSLGCRNAPKGPVLSGRKPQPHPSPQTLPLTVPSTFPALLGWLRENPNSL